jgi:hypothetical protein
VILNAIEFSGSRLVPVPGRHPFRLACIPVPERGLDIWPAVFGQACELGAGAERDVFSSRKPCGWHRDGPPGNCSLLGEPFLRSIAGIALDG